MEIPKPVAIAVASVFAVALIAGIWFATSNNGQGQQDPPAKMNEAQLRYQEDMDQYRRKTERPR